MLGEPAVGGLWGPPCAPVASLGLSICFFVQAPRRVQWASVSRKVWAREARHKDPSRISLPAFRDVGIQVDPEPEENLSEDPGEVSWELATALHQLLVECPVVWERPSMVAFRRIIAELGVELELCLVEAEVGVAGNHVPGLATSLAEHGINLAQEVELTGEAWNMDLLAMAMINGPAEARRAGWGTMEATWGQVGLEREACQVACELGPVNMGDLDVVATDPVEAAVVGETEVGVAGHHVPSLANSLAEHVTELSQEVELAGEEAMRGGLQVLLLDPNSGGGGPVVMEEASGMVVTKREAIQVGLQEAGPLIEVVSREVVTRGVVTRGACQVSCELGPRNMGVLDIVVVGPVETAVVGGTEVGVAGNHVTREVVTREVVTREVVPRDVVAREAVIQAVLQDAGPLRSPE